MTASGIFAMVVFSLIAAIGVAMALQQAIKPQRSFFFLRKISGFNFAPIINGDPAIQQAFRVWMSWQASALLGANVLTFFVAYMAFHDGHFAAWLALWYWPVLFLWHFVLYPKQSPFRYVQLLWLGLSVAVLLIVRIG